jgi:hypothetical protein
MPRLSFTVRDVFWLTLVVGMGAGWWMREREMSASSRKVQKQAHAFRSLLELDWHITAENDEEIAGAKRSSTWENATSFLYSHEYGLGLYGPNSGSR